MTHKERRLSPIWQAISQSNELNVSLRKSRSQTTYLTFKNKWTR